MTAAWARLALGACGVHGRAHGDRHARSFSNGIPPISESPQPRPPHVAPHSVALVDEAASAAAASSPPRVARGHALAARWPPRCAGSPRAASASAGGVVTPLLASAAAVGAESGSPATTGREGGRGGGAEGCTRKRPEQGA